MCGIYKITNLINGKCYIGQTSIGLEHRWAQHCSAAKYGCKFRLYLAINKYGKENFSIELIEECAADDLNQREIYWINYYHSNDRALGYNMTLGGEGRVKFDHELILQLWKDGLTTSQIAEKLECDKSNIWLHLKNEQIYDPEDGRMRACNLNKKPVCQYDMKGNFIARHDSIKSASDSVGIPYYGISNCCNSKQWTAGGYCWAYEGEQVNIHVSKTSKKVVLQYTLDDELVAEHESMREIREKLHIDLSGVIDCCKHRRLSYKGYIWKYKHE